MKFPKDRPIGRSAEGRQQARFLDTIGVSFLHRRMPDGTVAQKKGGELYVTPAQQLEDGFYSLGATTDHGTRIVGSPTARGRFTDSGPAPEAGGFVTTQLGFYGRGLGSVISYQDLGFFADFDGRACQMFKGTLARTRNGRRTKDYFTFNVSLPNGGGVAEAYSLRGGYRDVGGQPTFYAGMLHPTLRGDGQHVQVALCDDGETQTVGATPYWTDQLGWYGSPVLLAPGVFLKMDRYLRPHYEGSSVDAAACPGLYFTYTTDAGLTWAEPSSVSMFAAEMGTVVALPAVVANANLFNAAIGAAKLSAAPLSRRYSVAMAHVPYIDSSSGTPALKVRVKLGLIDVAAGCSVTATLTLLDGSPEEASVFGSRGLIAVPGGVLVATRPLRPAHDEWAHPMRLQFTSDGAALAEHAYMPLPEFKTGVLTGFDRKTLVCPMYDEAGHSLYESKDYGVTWRRRALIAANGVPPVSSPSPGNEQFALQDFGVITFLRNGDQAANAFPLTPWLNDSRVPAPIV